MAPVRIPELPLPGSLFIWRCPGLDGSALRFEDGACLSEAGVTHVVSLLTPHEAEQHGQPLSAERAALASRGLGFTSVPIDDFAAPTLSQARFLAAALTRLLERGEHVLVHCMAGLGRSGTVAALLLAHHGMAPNEAISLLRRVRPGAIESAEQEAVLRALCD